jgi:hypothetical protein
MTNTVQGLSNPTVIFGSFTVPGGTVNGAAINITRVPGGQRVRRLTVLCPALGSSVTASFGINGVATNLVNASATAAAGGTIQNAETAAGGLLLLATAAGTNLVLTIGGANVSPGDKTLDFVLELLPDYT